jgi:hypothetical protein
MGGVEFFQDEISGRSTAVSNHQHGDLIRAGASGFAHASATACGAWELSLSFERLKEIGFIRLNNAVFMVGAMFRRQCQEAMAPKEGRILVDTAFIGRFSNGSPLDQGTGKSEPLIAFTQTRERSVGQRIAGTPAGSAVIAGQTMARPPGPKIR